MEKQEKMPFDGFSKLNRRKRIDYLIKSGLLTTQEAAKLTSTKILPFSLAEKFIENFIGYFSIPLGVAVNFYIDDREYVIPMAVEETSVIAAASKTAKWIKQQGKIFTETLGTQSIGQIQISKVKNFNSLKTFIEKNKLMLLERINTEVANRMVSRGGGAKEIILRRLPRGDGQEMAVIHILVDTCDAMGANVINQICEYLRQPIAQATNETIDLCILSNLTVNKLTRATVVINDIDYKLGAAIAEASLFAKQDPYRAATNNKGVLNGMDAVAIATGNDWRALEAGIHAYAALQSKYSSITRWEMQGRNLIGTLEAPINVGVVGGVTRLHPTAELCLKILKVKNAAELARVMAAVGLVQNLGALRALTTEGICQGHMRLHINNLCLAAGAKPREIKKLKKNLEKIFRNRKHISVSDAVRVLNTLRN